MKKLMTLLMALSMILSLSMTAFAAEDGSINETMSDLVITDANEIARIQSEDPEDIPEGYHIEEIRFSTISAEEEYRPPVKRGMQELSPRLPGRSDGDAQIMLFDKWTVSGAKYIGDYYFTNKVLTSDWVDGKSSYTQTYTESFSGTFSSNTSVKASVVEAGVGFSVTVASSFEKSYKIDVPANKRMNVKVYGNHAKYSFNVYKNGQYQGDGYAYKPIGLIIKQTIYAK